MSAAVSDAARFEAIRDRLFSDVGGSAHLTEFQRQTVGALASLMRMREQMDEDRLAGQAVALDEYLAVTDRMQALAADLPQLRMVNVPPVKPMSNIEQARRIAFLLTEGIREMAGPAGAAAELKAAVAKVTQVVPPSPAAVEVPVAAPERPPVTTIATAVGDADPDTGRQVMRRWTAEDLEEARHRPDQRDTVVRFPRAVVGHGAVKTWRNR